MLANHPGSVSFRSSGSALPFPPGFSAHQLLMEMNGMSSLSPPLMFVSLSLDVCAELAPSAGLGPKGRVRSELSPPRNEAE